jgi:ribonuclease D
MAEYAVNDTRFLHRLAEIFDLELQRLGRRQWFDQVCDRAIRLTEVSRERDTEELWRIAGSGALRGRAAALLRELWRWRDEEAKALDRPPFHILHNEQLIATALAVDAGRDVEFKQVRGARLRRFRESIERALTMAEADWPKARSESPAATDA